MNYAKLTISKQVKAALKVFIALASLLIITLIFVAVYLSSNPNHFIKMLAAQIEENTGRTLVVGEAEIGLSFHPELIVKDVSLSNADWGIHNQMVTAEGLKIQLKLFALLLGEISFDQIEFIAPAFYLERNQHGHTNWNFINVNLPIMSVDHLTINKAQVEYSDSVSNRVDNFKIDHLGLSKLPETSLQTIELSAEYSDQQVEMSGKTGSLKSWFRNNDFPLEINIKSSGIQALITGKINRPIDFQGLDANLKLEAQTLSSFSAFADIKFPTIGPIGLDAQLTSQKNGYGLNDFSLHIGGTSFAGPIEIITTKSQPKIAAKLTAANFDTADFNPAIKQEKTEVPNDEIETTLNHSGQGGTNSVFSDNLLPLSILKAVDADVSFSAKNMTFFEASVQNMSSKLHLKNGQLNIKPMTAELADGSIRAALFVDASSEITKVNTEFHANQIDLGKLLQSLTGRSHLERGKTDIDLTLNGQGNSSRSLMSTLNGNMTSVTGVGQINHDLSLAGEKLILAVFKKMNPMKEKQKTTNLDCIVIHFDMVDGVATIDKSLAYESESLKVLGHGTIDLNTEKINILLSSKSTVAKFLQIKGPLAKPAIVANPIKALQKGTSLWVAVMTGGMSMAAEIVYDQATSDDSPCETALQKMAYEE